MSLSVSGVKTLYLPPLAEDAGQQPQPLGWKLYSDGCRTFSGGALRRCAVVVRLTPGGPAASCGLHVGDTLLGVNGVTIDKMKIPLEMLIHSTEQLFFTVQRAPPAQQPQPKPLPAAPQQTTAPSTKAAEGGGGGGGGGGGAALKMRGLPYTATEADVVQFFSGLKIAPRSVSFGHEAGGRVRRVPRLEHPTDQTRAEAPQRRVSRPAALTPYCGRGGSPPARRTSSSAPGPRATLPLLRPPNALSASRKACDERLLLKERSSGLHSLKELLRLPSLGLLSPVAAA